MHCACVFGDLVSLWSSCATVGTQHDYVNLCLLQCRLQWPFGNLCNEWMNNWERSKQDSSVMAVLGMLQGSRRADGFFELLHTTGTRAELPVECIEIHEASNDLKIVHG
jgi:hypothetical protein